jgi:hypothetical protein
MPLLQYSLLKSAPETDALAGMRRAFESAGPIRPDVCPMVGTSSWGVAMVEEL